jgi:hypothetical protein
MIKLIITIATLSFVTCSSNLQLCEQINNDIINNKIRDKEIDSTNIPNGLLKITDKIMVNNYYELSNLKRHIYLYNGYYYVIYDFVNKNALGGGGILILNKDLKLHSQCFTE